MAAAPDKLLLTTPDGKFTIRTVACFGQCALAPVVELDHRICGHMNEGALAREVARAGGGEPSMTRIEDIGAFNAVREAGLAKLLPRGAADRGRAWAPAGAATAREAVYHALGNAIERDGMDMRLVSTGCFGACSQEAHGQRVDSRPAAGDAAARAGVATRSGSWRR